ncbi:hypothetical protein L598_000900000790 [Mesorhizobium sp. J18]|uniref:hypothetical protein n=1 Tax=Mesorhizobium sp. J18 TaxID=935263 RepID=UPI00119C1AE7|nr:hypothetical protein [Mesorhizobium sp. J18]TWG89000.1 hypothetical protein L598_000900000790 [Mesorhizobium sp. J18]
MNGIHLGLREAVLRLAVHYRDHRRRVRTERILNDLPVSIRKDIGWPNLAA